MSIITSLIKWASFLLFLTISIKGIAQPPYDPGTIDIDPDIFLPSDPTTFESISYTGRGIRTVFDRRTNDWIEINAFLFDVVWNDGLTSEAIINPEFNTRALSEVEADKYARLIGQLPTCLRKDVNRIWIHKGHQLFGGGNNAILIHTEQAASYVQDGILVETLMHEAAHTSLDAAHDRSDGWIAAQSADGEFISTYARDNPFREDIAESLVPWYAVRHRADRISSETFNTITQTIPNRLQYLDNIMCDLSPVDNMGGGCQDAAAAVVNCSSGTTEVQLVNGSVKVDIPVPTFSDDCSLTNSYAWIFDQAQADWVPLATDLGAGGGTVSYTFTAEGSHQIDWYGEDGVNPRTRCTNYINVVMPQAVASGVLDFDGVDDRVNLGSALGNFGTGDFTIEFWMKAPQVAANSYIISKRGVCGCDNFWNIILQDNGMVALEAFENASCGNPISLGNTSSVNDNTWHHIAITRQNGLLRMYTDGVEEGVADGSNNTNLNNNHDLVLGHNVCNDMGSTTTYKGQLDELRIWNVAKPADRLSCQKDEILLGSESGLDAYYIFDEGSGTSLFNWGGTALGQTGELQNCALTGSTSNWVAGGGPTLFASGAGGCCPASDRVSNTITSGTYIAGTTLMVDGTVPSGNTVILKGGNTIEFEPPFEAAQGAAVDAIIEGCPVVAPVVDSR